MGKGSDPTVGKMKIVYLLYLYLYLRPSTFYLRPLEKSRYRAGCFFTLKRSLEFLILHIVSIIKRKFHNSPPPPPLGSFSRSDRHRSHPWPVSPLANSQKQRWASTLQKFSNFKFKKSRIGRLMLPTVTFWKSWGIGSDVFLHWKCKSDP
jgi:hypothetical protein